MIDNLFGGDDEDGADDVDDEEIGGLFDDPGDGGHEADGEELSGDDGEELLGDDGGPGGEADLAGEEDLVGDDDLMGGGGGGGGASTGEVTRRLDELENDVDALSSTVNTVKSENEQLSGSIDDVEENIRKLLEVYEMVTRGVNPFVNENEFGDAFDGAGDGDADGGSMALFGGEEDGADADDIDESVANADAGDFFEDDLEEDEGADAGDDGDFEDGDAGGIEGVDDGAGELDGETGELDDTFDDVDDLDGASGLDGDLDGTDGLDEAGDLEAGGDDEADEGADGGQSFEDLKSKYETGEDDSDADGTDGTDDAVDDLGAAAGAVDGPDGAAVEGGKPYLQSVPDGYAADVVVLDWLEFLVDEAGVDGAARTIAYYEAIEWVSETAAEHLRTYLRGFGDDVVTDPEPRSWLTVSHHETSLRFIARIDDPASGLVAFDPTGRGVPPGVRSGPQRGGPATGDARGHGSGVGSVPRSGPELESDGGRRTPDEGGASRYQPAATRRRRGRYGDGDHTCEVGYGGFCWNHEER